jgi:hypothetical protein
MRFFLTGLFFYSVAVAAQDSLCEQLVGKWRAEGTLMGAPASFRLDWDYTLDKKFFKLTFENHRDGARASFKAEAYYRVTADSFTGTWFDNRGWTLPLKGRLTDSSLTAEWGDATTEIGRTEYVLIDGDRLRVMDWVYKKSEWKLFGTAVYAREK